MVTEQRGSPRMSGTVPRIGFLVAGCIALLVGWLLWSMEQEYGGWGGTGLGHHVVGYDDATGVATVVGEDGAVLFEGSSQEEAEAWIESQRDRDFTVPVVVLSAGVVLVFLGAVPRRAGSGGGHE